MKDKMGGTCSPHEALDNYIQNFSWEDTICEALSVDGKDIEINLHEIGAPDRNLSRE
jgi:hypothetical protein